MKTYLSALFLWLCPLAVHATTLTSPNYQINASPAPVESVTASSPSYTATANLGVISSQAVATSLSYKLGPIAVASAPTTLQPYTTADALMALRIAVGLNTATPAQMARYDVAPLVNGGSEPDGKITPLDALVILDKAIGAIP